MSDGSLDFSAVGCGGGSLLSPDSLGRSCVGCADVGFGSSVGAGVGSGCGVDGFASGSPVGSFPSDTVDVGSTLGSMRGGAVYAVLNIDVAVIYVSGTVTGTEPVTPVESSRRRRRLSSHP